MSWTVISKCLAICQARDTREGCMLQSAPWSGSVFCKRLDSAECNMEVSHSVPLDLSDSCKVIGNLLPGHSPNQGGLSEAGMFAHGNIQDRLFLILTHQVVRL